MVFIGNIPYGVSEEMIMEIFSSCGKVVNFRLVYDKETGQPKGFGFLEYSDTDSAQSAIRNLNEYELNGRTLRVDFSNDNRATKNEAQNNNQGNRAPPPAHFDAAPPAARPDSAALPPLPQGVQLPPGVTAFDAISKVSHEIHRGAGRSTHSAGAEVVAKHILPNTTSRRHSHNTRLPTCSTSSAR